MKAQFKYSFLTGLHVRLPVFAVITVMMLVFGVLGSLGLLPEAALITAVSLGGVSIAVMMAFNIQSDVVIARRMFRAPDAYLYALTPARRGHTLFSSLITMLVLDIVTFAVIVTGEIWLSLNLAGNSLGQAFLGGISGAWSELLPWLWWIPYAIFVDLLIVQVVVFSAVAGKSILYKKPASGFLSFLLACGCFYLWSLLNLILAPFGSLERFGVFFTVNLNGAGVIPLILLTALEATGLFVLTAKLLERKINI